MSAEADAKRRRAIKMMMSEFIERTGYEPTYEEYHHIEESYYEFDGKRDKRLLIKIIGE